MVGRAYGIVSGYSRSFRSSSSMNAARIGTFAAGVVLGEQHLHRGNQFARPPVRHGDRIVIAELDNIVLQVGARRLR